MTHQPTSRISRARLVCWLLCGLLWPCAAVAEVDDPTALFIGFIKRLHSDRVHMRNLQSMLDTAGAIHPMSEHDAAQIPGGGVYWETLRRMLERRDTLDWRAIRTHVTQLDEQKSAEEARRNDNTQTTREPWFKMNFIDIPAGQIPDPNDDHALLTNPEPLRVMDSHVSQAMFADVMGHWPKDNPKAQHLGVGWWFGRTHRHPNSPVVRWSFRDRGDRNPGAVFLDELNKNHKIRGWRYDVPTLDERRYIVASALYELLQQFPRLFWHTGDNDSIDPSLYGAYFNQQNYDAMCSIKSFLPLHIHGRPIWDLFGLVDDLSYAPHNRGTFGCGTRGGRNIVIPTTNVDALNNHWLLTTTPPSRRLNDFLEAEQQAYAHPYKFWVNFLDKVHGNSDGWPLYQTGLRLVLRRANAARAYYRRVLP